MEHDWQKSTLGHGNKMCSRCFATDLEAAVLGLVECDGNADQPNKKENADGAPRDH